MPSSSTSAASNTTARAPFRVAVLQSNYIPWKGYFDIIRHVDCFVFLDDVQYTIRDWRNRNRIKTPAGPQWLTIPCGADRNRRVCDVRVDASDWQLDHWRQLEKNYRNAPYWARYESRLREWYLARRWEYLSELNQYVTRTIASELLALPTAFEDSRRFNVTSTRTERLVDLVTRLGATDYLSGPAARAYIQPELFAAAGVNLHYFDYSGYPEYPQMHGPFVHEVSVLDLLFQTGDEALRYLDRAPLAPAMPATSAA
jgi:hypothetical protein